MLSEREDFKQMLWLVPPSKALEQMIQVSYVHL